jgi:DNA-binding response OmpR family regulator
MMRGMDGMVCASPEERRENLYIPVVLLTAKAGREDRLRGLDMGAMLLGRFRPAELSGR